MSFKHIKLMDLLPLREAEEKDAAAEDEGGGENPFAAADAEGGEEGGDAAAEEPAADAEGGDGEEEGGDKKATPTNFPIKFNIGKVKKYNNANFISDQGELKSIDKKGLVVTVKPDEVDIFVNFSDIL